MERSASRYRWLTNGCVTVFPDTLAHALNFTLVCYLSALNLTLTLTLTLILTLTLTLTLTPTLTLTLTLP